MLTPWGESMPPMFFLMLFIRTYQRLSAFIRGSSSFRLFLGVLGVCFLIAGQDGRAICKGRRPSTVGGSALKIAPLQPSSRKQVQWQN
jgi:hypothetical protein